jgi:DNA-binding beta-propeller fold protein YncE
MAAKIRTGLSRAALIGAMSLLSLAMMAPSVVRGNTGTFLPSGQYITPELVPGSVYTALNPEVSQLPNIVAGGAVSTALSPDGTTLAVLTCGYNSWSIGAQNVTNEYIFIYNVFNGAPVQEQIIQLANTFVGITFSPDGNTLWIGGGQDDSVHSFKKQAGQWTEKGKPIALGYTTANGLYPGDYPPMVGGLAITADGSTMVVANYSNDSVSIINLSTRKVLSSFDLRPGIINPAQSGVPGGEYPFWVSLKGTTAYVSCARDREIDVVDFSTPTTPKLVTRIAVAGNPLKTTLDSAQAYLYVAEDNSDLVQIISTSNNTVFQSVTASGPNTPTFANALKYKGSAPVAPAISADGSTLYVTLGGANAISVITGIPAHPVVVGLIPTGYQPDAITLNNTSGETWAYVADAKGVTGPNPGETYNNGQPNSYVYQLQKSYLHSFPIPNATDLATLTTQVAQNNSYGSTLSPSQQAELSFLQAHIKHVVYLEKENRTYDQILGDLAIGNGDPTLVDFGEAITPNYHTIAQQFVDLDNFYNTGDVSGDGQIWSVAGRENTLSFIGIPMNYSGRGAPYDSEGQNRDINMGFPTAAGRQQFLPASPSDPNILPGTLDVGAVDGPGAGDQQQGYLWDVVIRAGLTFRNYGYHCDQAEYFATPPTPLLLNPRKTKVRVAFPSRVALMSRTDPYFRSFDNNFPDFYREKEWEFEFENYVKNNNLPAVSMVRLMHDHMGSFGTAILGVNTPEIQQADNDYAVAKLIEKIAKSPYANSTLICILEDDSQNGADHVDSHRATAYLAGAYVKQGAVVSTAYTTQNMLATIEAVLGLDHEDILTASQMPMLDCFDVNQTTWSFKAVPSSYLYNTQLPLPPRGANAGPIPKSTHDAKYWAEATKGFDFTREDNLKDPNKFNRIIWEGLHGKNVPYPVVRSGLDLRQNRSELLKKAGVVSDETSSN